MNSKSNRKIALFIKVIAIIASLYGLIRSYSAPIFFTYFTVLSNIFILIMLLIFAYKDYVYIAKRRNIKYPNALYVIKFLATISITLTGVVFLTILAPLMPGGFISAYMADGAGSLCLHLVMPLFALIDFLFFDLDYESDKSHVICSIIPPLMYVVFVVILSKMGVRWGNMYAPYNFLNYHSEVGWFGFDLSKMGWESMGIGVAYMIVILSIIFYLLGLLFLKIRRKNKKKKRKKSK